MKLPAADFVKTGSHLEPAAYAKLPDSESRLQTDAFLLAHPSRKVQWFIVPNVPPCAAGTPAFFGEGPHLATPIRRPKTSHSFGRTGSTAASLHHPGPLPNDFGDGPFVVSAVLLDAIFRFPGWIAGCCSSAGSLGFIEIRRFITRTAVGETRRRGLAAIEEEFRDWANG